MGHQQSIGPNSWLHKARISLGMCPANERHSYIVTTSLTGWAIPRLIPDKANHCIPRGRGYQTNFLHSIIFSHFWDFKTVCLLNIAFIFDRCRCSSAMTSTNMISIKDQFEQSGIKPNLVAKILATEFGVFFCYIYNIFKNMSLMIMW